ncbi:MAG: hypothetical protein RLZZ292_741 [Bacteroidota bacterium]|jgi:hypothetical protein
MIKTKLSEKDYINVTFVLLYSKPFMKFFMGTIAFAIISSLLVAIYFPITSYSQRLIPIVIGLIMPLTAYFSAKKSYAAYPRISETIEYQFEEDNLVIKGESFNSQLTWDKIYKVTQKKNWLLIWQNSQMANIIPQRDLLEGQIKDLKTILNRHNVKNNL